MKPTRSRHNLTRQLAVLACGLLVLAINTPLMGQVPAQRQSSSSVATPAYLQVARANPRVQQAGFQAAPDAQLEPSFGTLPNPASVASVRIKDITSIEGERGNKLQGVGLVVGLKNTGGKDPVTRQLATNWLNRRGYQVSDISTVNMSAVSVTAEIPPRYKKGEKIVATVAAIDNAMSLFGGELIQTELSGIDGQIYAIASGAVILGGVSASGAGASVAKNHDTAGKVEAIVEVEIQTEPAFPDRFYRLLLNNKDYATANAIAVAVNRLYPNHARPLDQGTVEIYFPREFEDRKLQFSSAIGQLRVTPDIRALVLINERTGTILAGRHVKLSKFMFGLDNLIVTTSETPVASQPAPLAGGQTAILPRTDLTVTETGGRYNVINEQTTVGDLASALNALGASPREMITVFRAAAASGSLQAEIRFE